MSPESANPSTWGPMTTPPMIRNNTCGDRPGTSREMTGATAATAVTSSSDHRELSLIGQALPSAGSAAEPRGRPTGRGRGAPDRPRAPPLRLPAKVISHGGLDGGAGSSHRDQVGGLTD